MQNKTIVIIKYEIKYSKKYRENICFILSCYFNKKKSILFLILLIILSSYTVENARGVEDILTLLFNIFVLKTSKIYVFTNGK